MQLAVTVCIEVCLRGRQKAEWRQHVAKGHPLTQLYFLPRPPPQRGKGDRAGGLKGNQRLIQNGGQSGGSHMPWIHVVDPSWGRKKCPRLKPPKAIVGPNYFATFFRGPPFLSALGVMESPSKAGSGPKKVVDNRTAQKLELTTKPTVKLPWFGTCSFLLQNLMASCHLVVL